MSSKSEVKKEKDIPIGYKIKVENSVGSFFVLSRLGHGGMGRIHKGLQLIKYGNDKDLEKFIEVIKQTCEIEDDIYKFKSLHINVLDVSEIKELSEKRKKLSELYPVSNQTDLDRIKEDLKVDIYARLVAIKPYLEKRGKLYKSDEKKFWEEIEIMKELLGVPNTVQFITTLKDDEGIWLIMEYVDGLNLKDIINNSKIREKYGSGLPLVTSAAITYYIARGLAEIHDKGIIHNDIKPENIMVSFIDNEVKITDFGVSFRLDYEGKFYPSGLSLGYSAPEILLAYYDEEKRKEFVPDYRLDIWSLGVLAYELITGKKPFDQSVSVKEDYIKTVKEGEIPPLEKYIGKKNIGKSEKKLEEILRRCMNPDKEKRYSSAYDVMEDLYKYLTSKGINLKAYKYFINLITEPFTIERTSFYKKLQEDFEGTLLNL